MRLAKERPLPVRSLIWEIAEIQSVLDHTGQTARRRQALRFGDGIIVPSMEKEHQTRWSIA
jgi:hypothetical protein